MRVCANGVFESNLKNEGVCMLRKMQAAQQEKTTGEEKSRARERGEKKREREREREHHQRKERL